MTSLVLELQKDALDRNVPISDLLRKALVVARKLGLHDLEEWIHSELNGYVNGQNIPAYRNLHGQVMAFNPYRGWQPVRFQDTKVEALVSTRFCNQSIAELEANNAQSGTLAMKLPPDFEARVGRNNGINLEVALIVQHSSIAKIFDEVRNTILEWSLKLEQDGIRGEGMAFTSEEKQRVANTGSYNIEQPMRDVLVGFGTSAWQAEGLIEDYAHYRRGEASALSSAIKDVTGAPPHSFAEFARDYRQAFLASTGD